MKGKGFLNAGELKAGEKVVDSEGGTYAIENIYIEIVESPETVYNFHVEDLPYIPCWEYRGAGS